MIELTDEILNKYLDGELEYTDLIKVHELLKESDEARKRLKALQAVHSSLKEMKEYSPSEGFTYLIMSRLYNRVKAKKGQKFFIYSVSGVFVILSLAIIGFAVSIILNSAPITNSADLNRTVLSYSEKFSNIIRNIFSGSSISIFGSVLSLGIIIFSYFFFEFQKSFKAKQSK
ncbi:MAG TPA: hypothetical protein VMT35_13860 [Ignavibacteriaceae bacterium]|nr:hypothetical protein [Ignavibacteriaceae bacterium]